jgi:hypothetical protein
MRRIDLPCGKLFPLSIPVRLRQGRNTSPWMMDRYHVRSVRGSRGNYHGEADLSAARPELEKAFSSSTPCRVDHVVMKREVRGRYERASLVDIVPVDACVCTYVGAVFVYGGTMMTTSPLRFAATDGAVCMHVLLPYTVLLFQLPEQRGLEPNRAQLCFPSDARSARGPARPHDG